MTKPIVRPVAVVRPVPVATTTVVAASPSSEFHAPYEWRKDNEVCIRSAHGKHLRVSPARTREVDGLGGQGEFARWRIHIYKSKHCKIQSMKTGQYLRIHKGHVDAAGGGGKFCEFKFKIDDDHPRIVRLKSDHGKEPYLCIRADGAVIAVEKKKREGWYGILIVWLMHELCLQYLVYVAMHVHSAN